MASNSSSSEGGDGGYGGGAPPTFDQILYMSLDSDAVTLTIWTAIGTMAVALVESKILMDTSTYFDYFGDTDSLWAQIGVAIGTMTTMAHLVICCAQTWMLTQHSITDFHTVFYVEGLLGHISSIFGCGLNFAAVTFYTLRAYRMSGRNRWLGGILMRANVGTLVVGMLASVKGIMAPNVTYERVMELAVFWNEFLPIKKTWAAFSILSDGAVCIVMFYFLFQSRDSVFHREKKLFYKFHTLIVESMLPPVICLFIVGISPSCFNWRKICRMLLPVLYFVSLAHSLVARATIRKMLDQGLSANGVKQVGGSGGGAVYVTSYTVTDVSPTNGEDGTGVSDVQASTDHILPFQSYHRASSPTFEVSKA